MRTTLTLLALLIPALARAAEKPNFVIIFIDDMGYGDIEPFGSRVNRTPALNRMAAEGLKMTSFYAAPVCSASRAQLLTGCYAPRVSVPGVFFPAGPKGLNPKEHTIADYLRDLGYATSCVGKWHLGDQPEFLPTNQGFDHYFGIPYSNDMQRVSAADGRKVTPLLRDDKVEALLEDEQQRQVTRAYTEEAVRFIRSHGEKPFFLYLAHTAMHVPLFPHQDFVGKSENGTYGDWVAEVDWSVGQVLDAIRETDQAKDTLVIFTSDNGPWASKGKAGGVSGPLRGSKGGTLEGGVREPTIAWWPGRIKPGESTDAIGGTTDLLPTLVSLAGGEVRKDVRIDGVDLSGLLLDRSETSPRSEWFYYHGTNLQAVRSGPWKLALTGQSLGMGIREKPDDLKGGNRLYNLNDDLGETTNLFEKHPQIVARLRELADQMQGDIGSGKPGPGVRPPGLNTAPVTLYSTKPNNRRRGANAGPIRWERLKPGDTFASAAAPNIANRAFTLRCEVSDISNGVLIAHGGSAAGYALYAHDGQVTFAVRTGPQSIRRVTAKRLGGETVSLVARLSPDGHVELKTKSGIWVGEYESDEKGPQIGRRPQEDFCVGHDNGNPVDSKAPRNRFRGKLTKISVEVAK